MAWSTSAEGQAVLQRLREDDRTLTQLDLGDNRIGDKGAEALATALKTNASLRELYLTDNKIGDKGAEALATALKTNASLRELNLWNNSIGDKGAEALATALKTNASLRELNLRYNDIGDKGAEALATALKTNASLRVLNLQGNKIGDKGAEALATALKTNASLRELDLTGNSIGDKGAEALATALKTNASLRELDLERNYIGDKGAEALATALKTNKSLIKLYLSGNNIGDELQSSIKKALERNKRERTESKRKANELLASETVTAQDLRALLDADGTLDASPLLGRNRDRVLDTAECVKAVTRHAAAALQSCGITCLDLRGNKHLDTLPARELCGIEGLTAVECKGCSSLTTIPQSVAEGGGEEAMAALHESLYSSLMSQFTTDVAKPMEQEDYAAARDMLVRFASSEHVTSLPAPTRQLLQVKLDKIEANILLASELESAKEGFQRLLRPDGTLDASPMLRGEMVVADALCVRAVTRHAAAALQSCGITCLDLSANPHLVTMATGQLCAIASLVKVECVNCPQLGSPPVEVAAQGGEEAMKFLRDCEENGATNGSMALVMLGDGEAGKTSVQKAIQNEQGNTAPKIGKDTRTVGMDTVVYTTKDLQGQEIAFRIQDVGGQQVYRKILEFFLVTRAVYLFLYRADSALEDISESATQWLNMLQACVPGVTVLPVVTHIDRVSTRDLEEQGEAVQGVFKQWTAKQNSLPNPQRIPLVRVLYNGKSLRVNCLKGDGIADLRAAILKTAADTRGFREPLPKPWLDLREAMRALQTTRKFITWDEYKELALACGITEDRLLAATFFLHDTLEIRDFGLSARRQTGLVPSTHLKDMAPADPQPAPSVPDTTYTMPAQTVTKAVTKVAVADYAALEPDELSFKQGDQIAILGDAEDAGWHRGYLNGQTGLVPSTHLKDMAPAGPRRQLEDLEDFLARVLSQAVEGDKMQDVRALFDKIDADGSGAIDRDELRAFAQTHGLGNASIDLLMRSADDDESGEIEFEEFRRRFELAQSAAQSNVLLNLIYLNLEWMIDVVKGVVRHDTAALLQFLQDTGEMELQHLARRMRVQGIVAQELIDEFLLWPGNPDSAFWSKVEVEGGGETTSFAYERSLWLDGAKNLKKVVESAEDTRAALGLLLGFKILLRLNAKELYCADIVPKHTKNTIHGVSLDSVHCAYWMIRRYLRLPSGFWDTLYMEIRSLATSGSNSTHIQTVFLLSAKIQIMQTQDDDGRIRIDARASTRAAFEVAQNALATVAKYYRGMALWEVSTERISAEDSAKIVEPAQVLVMTSKSLVCKSSAAIQSFNTAVSNVDGAPGRVKQEFIEAARARADGANQVLSSDLVIMPIAGGVEGAGGAGEIVAPEASSIHAVNSKVQAVRLKLEALRARLNTPDGDHFIGSFLLAEIAEDVNCFSESVILPEYRRHLRGVNRPTSTSEAKKLDKALFKALKEGNASKAEQLLLQGADPSYASYTCCLMFEFSTSAIRTKAIRSICLMSLFLIALLSIVVSRVQPWGLPDDASHETACDERYPTWMLVVGVLTMVIPCCGLVLVGPLELPDWDELDGEDKQIVSVLFCLIGIPLAVIAILMWISMFGSSPQCGGVMWWIGCAILGFTVMTSAGAVIRRVLTTCRKHQSSIAEANTREELQALLHKYGCDDENLEMPEHIKQKAKAHSRLEKRFERIEEEMEKRKEAFTQPRSKLPATTAEDTRTSALEWIQILYRVLDERFPGVSKEIFSPHSNFRGEAEVVLVLLDETTSRSQEVCDRFRELHAQGCKIIGVLMPGYPDIANYSEWWPKEMLDFKDHSLFFDCRAGPNGDQWNGRWEVKMQMELLPQIAQFLEEWTKTSPGADGSISAANPAPGPLVEKVYASKQEMRDSRLPCPECLKQGKTSPGTFSRDECMLFFLSKREGSNTKGTFFCGVCQIKVRVNDILKRPIFLSYNWGNNNSTQKIATRLCKRIFLATEMPYWLDVDGGMAFGDELVTEMKEGVAGCEIVVLMISDAFCNSGNCMFEFINIVANRKHVIPLLVPDRGGTRTGPSGWTGQYQGEDWWKHARDICDPQRPDLLAHPAAASFKDIPWHYLADFDPIDLRDESYQDDGSLRDNSPAENEIIRRIISRFFRSVAAHA